MYNSLLYLYSRSLMINIKLCSKKKKDMVEYLTDCIRIKGAAKDKCLLVQNINLAEILSSIDLNWLPYFPAESGTPSYLTARAPCLHVVWARMKLLFESPPSTMSFLHAFFAAFNFCPSESRDESTRISLSHTWIEGRNLGCIARNKHLKLNLLWPYVGDISNKQV